MFIVIRLISLGLAISFTFASAAQAAFEIDCPLSQPDTLITSNLPDGWQHAPNVDDFVAISLADINGKQMFMCGYQANGETAYIQRAAPDGATCSPTEYGFFCTTPVVEAPITAINGQFSLTETESIDLDNGSSGGEGADLAFETVTATERYLSTQNGAALTIIDGAETGLSACENLNYTRGRTPLDSLTEGTYVCVLTNEARYSQFRITATSPGSVEIDYTTWDY